MTTAKAIRNLITAILDQQKVEYPAKRNTEGLARILDKECEIAINILSGEVFRGEQMINELRVGFKSVNNAYHSLQDCIEENGRIEPCEITEEKAEIIIKDEPVKKEVAQKTEVKNDGFGFNIPNLNMADIIGKGIEQAINQLAPAEIDKKLKSYAEEATKHLKPMVIKIAGRKDVKMNKRTHKAFEETLMLSNVERQVFMSGPAGTGKTTLGSNIAEAMGIGFSSISCSAGMSEAHLLGRMLFDGEYIKSDFVECYENGGGVSL